MPTFQVKYKDMTPEQKKWSEIELSLIFIVPCLKLKRELTLLIGNLMPLTTSDGDIKKHILMLSNIATFVLSFFDRKLTDYKQKQIQIKKLRKLSRQQIIRINTNI